jgi:hypothetical protein
MQCISARSACLTSLGRLGEARLNTTPLATTHVMSPIVSSAGHSRLRRPRWGTAGRAGEELLGAMLTCTAGRGPKRICWPRAAAEAAKQNATKPHRMRTYWDAGRERAQGAAGTCQAGASTPRRHWPWTRMDSRASSGPDERYKLRVITRTLDWRSKRLL